MEWPAPGTRSTEHWRVGRDHQVFGGGERSVGMCVSVTYWGSGRIRWVRLRHHDGTEKSYAPSQVHVLP